MFQQAQCTTALRERMLQPSLTMNGRHLMPGKASPSANTIQTRGLQLKTHPHNRNPLRTDLLSLVRKINLEGRGVTRTVRFRAYSSIRCRTTGRTLKRSNPRRRESAVCACDPVRRTTLAIDTRPTCDRWLKPGLTWSRDQVCGPKSLTRKLKSAARSCFAKQGTDAPYPMICLSLSKPPS